MLIFQMDDKLLYYRCACLNNRIYHKTKWWHLNMHISKYWEHAISRIWCMLTAVCSDLFFTCYSGFKYILNTLLNNLSSKPWTVPRSTARPVAGDQPCHDTFWHDSAEGRRQTYLAWGGQNLKIGLKLNIQLRENDRKEECCNTH